MFRGLLTLTKVGGLGIRGFHQRLEEVFHLD